MLFPKAPPVARSRRSPLSIGLSTDAFCIGATSIAPLLKCPTVMGTLVGKGINVRRKFAVLSIKGKLYMADTLRGTLFDDKGEHNNDVHLRVIDFPDLHEVGAQEVKCD